MSPYLALVLSLAASARAANPAPFGWDECRWNDQTHQTPKYVIGRQLAPNPHTPIGLKNALPVIKTLYPGTKIVGGDRLDIPCVGVVDVINEARTESGSGWSWNVVSDKCGECKPSKCEGKDLEGKNCGAGAGGTSSAGKGSGKAGRGVIAQGAATGGEMTPGAGRGAKGGAAAAGAEGKPLPPPCLVPNPIAVIRQVLEREGMKEAINRACRNGTDWTFPDAVVDELREQDERWGYWCRRGNCSDPSHDVLAYYCGTGNPEGSGHAAGVDYITASCYNPGDPPTAGVSWSAAFGSGGQPAWTGRGRF